MGNYFSPTVTIVPLTSKDKKPGQPTHYRLDIEKYPFLTSSSTALCESPRTLDKRLLKKYLGKIDKDDLEKVDEALAAHLSLIHIWYLADSAKDIVLISSDVPVTGGEELLIDTIQDENISIDETIIKKDMLKDLCEAMASLSSDEKAIIQTLYFSGHIVTEAEAGKNLGMSQQVLHYRKKKIFSKLAKFLFVKS